MILRYIISARSSVRIPHPRRRWGYILRSVACMGKQRFARDETLEVQKVMKFRDARSPTEFATEFPDAPQVWPRPLSPLPLT